MALSQADFYAYSRATGAPVPEDPRERAEMAPEVLAFRRNQLKAPEQQGPDPLSVGIGVGLALAGAGGALFGARRLMRGKAVVPSQAELDRAKAATEERVKRAAPTTTGPVGNVLRDLSSVSAPPPSRVATADTPVSRQQVPSGQFSNVPTRANQPGSFKDLTDIQNEITAEAKTDDFLNAYLKEQQEEQQAIDKENRFQSRIVQGIESKEKALAKNILADLRREEQEAKQFTPRSYIEETGAVAPIEDLTTKQNTEIVNVTDQQTNAVESGEDQFTGRQLRDVQRDTDATTGRLPVEDQINTQEVAAQEFLDKKINASPSINLDATYTYKDLKNAGLPDFEINARMQAFANTGEKALLNPEINSKTVGHAEFLKLLGVRNAKIDNQNRLLDGELVNPEGDIRTSPFAKKQTGVQELLDEDENFDPIAREVTGLAGGVSTAPVKFKENVKLSEQYETAIQNFRAEWDRNVRENINRLTTGEGDYSDIVMPARAERVVDIDDLDIPVRIETDNEGRVLNRTLYRDILPIDVVDQIEAGQKITLDVPFMVNKGRAYLDYRRNPTLANKAVAKDYQRTGRALVEKYDQLVSPYEGSKYIPELQEGRFFEPGETGITPESGPGSQRGKLIGGVTEEPLSQPLVPLKYQFVPEENKFKTYGFSSGVPLVPVETLDELKELGPLLDTQGNQISVLAAQQRNTVMTQPMSVRRITPVMEINQEGKEQQKIAKRFSRKTNKLFFAPLVTIEDVLVDAPLQVLNAKTGKEISGAAQIPKFQLNKLLDQFEGQIRSSGKQAGYLDLATMLDEYLTKTQNIKLPVLSSNTAFNFIEDLRGRPGSRPTTVMYGTTGKLGEIYPIAADQIETFMKLNELPDLGKRKAGQTRFASTTLSRQTTGAPTFSVQEAPKGRLTGIAAEDEDLLQQQRDITGSIFDESELGYSGFRNVELGSARTPGLLQQKLTPATTGIGAEMEALRKESESIKGENWKKQFPHLFPQNQPKKVPPGNLEVVTQQLMAQAGRRAGKRRNR